MKIDYQEETTTVVKTANEVSPEYSKIIISNSLVETREEDDKVILIFKQNK